MKRHDLKVLPDFFKSAKMGLKTAELRKNDRDYQVGDILRLREWSLLHPGLYTGDEILRKITHITDVSSFFPGYVLLSMVPVNEEI